jgi:hypothetical protein
MVGRRTVLTVGVTWSIFGWAFCACAGDLDDPERFAAQPAVRTTASSEASPDPCGDVPTTVFQKRCAEGCHNAEVNASGVDLASPDVASRLLARGALGGGVLVDPKAPKSSVLYTKLTSLPPYGSRMPPGAPLDDATIACVLSWITSVASTDTKAGSEVPDSSAPDVHMDSQASDAHVADVRAN